ncbi:hypothetical protein VTI74DRAFT_1523 [Chaetomium olivicolor]
MGASVSLLVPPAISSNGAPSCAVKLLDTANSLALLRISCSASPPLRLCPPLGFTDHDDEYKHSVSCWLLSSHTFCCRRGPEHWPCPTLVPTCPPQPPLRSINITKFFHLLLLSPHHTPFMSSKDLPCQIIEQQKSTCRLSRVQGTLSCESPPRKAPRHRRRRSLGS